MTININRRSTGSRDLPNMCLKAVRCWISQFKRWIYLASCFRAVKTWNEQQLISHCPSCSRPVLRGCSSQLGSATLPKEQVVHFSAGMLLLATLGRQDSFLVVSHILLESVPWKCIHKGTGKCLQTSWFCMIRQETIIHLSNLSQMI